MAKGNSHRKLYRPDYFGWFWYCQHAALNQKRFDKLMAKKAARKERKASVKEAEEGKTDSDSVKWTPDPNVIYTATNTKEGKE